MTACWNCGDVQPKELGGSDGVGNPITTCSGCGERQEEE